MLQNGSKLQSGSKRRKKIGLLTADCNVRIRNIRLSVFGFYYYTLVDFGLMCRNKSFAERK
jgi:hypothetical protein